MGDSVTMSHIIVSIISWLESYGHARLRRTDGRLNWASSPAYMYVRQRDESSMARWRMSELCCTSHELWDPLAGVSTHPHTKSRDQCIANDSPTTTTTKSLCIQTTDNRLNAQLNWPAGWWSPSRSSARGSDPSSALTVNTSLYIVHSSPIGQGSTNARGLGGPKPDPIFCIF